MKPEDIITIVSLSLSILAFFFSLMHDRYLYGPKCRIIVNSVSDGKGFSIQLENVGNRIMRLKRVLYSTHYDPDAKTSYTDNICSFFYSIPCESMSAARLYEMALFPNSKHNLITITFNNQADLVKAWEIVSRMRVKAEYKGFIRKHIYVDRALKMEYQSFMDAMNDGNGGMRKLHCFDEKLMNRRRVPVFKWIKRKMRKVDNG